MLWRKIKEDGVVLSRVVEKGLFEKWASEKTPDGGGRISRLYTCRKSLPDSEQ